MSQTSLVRVTVASATRRVDLVLPGAVPVTELVPELARSVGLLEPTTVPGGYRLVLPEGRALAGDRGLITQGVADGALLTVSADVDVRPPRRYDDPAEAMAEVVARDVGAWQPGAGRRTARGAALVLLVLGAAALATQGGRPAGVGAGVVALALVVAAIVLARVGHPPEDAVTLAWIGTAFAAVGGLLLVAAGAGSPGRSGSGGPLVGAGGGTLVAGLCAVVGLRAGRSLIIPPVIVGGLVTAAGVVVDTMSFDPAAVLTTALVLVVILGSAFPSLAVGGSGAVAGEFLDVDHLPVAPVEIDLAGVAADARVAHDLLVAFTVSVGMLLVGLVPFAVSLGASGAMLAVVCCLVVMGRARAYHSGRAVLACLGSGIGGLAMTVVALIWLFPEWRLAVASALTASGVLVLASTLVPRRTAARLGHLADVAETVSLVALLPLLVTALGVFGIVRDRV